MSSARTAILTLSAMLAFAGNSLLCRLALNQGGMDPASFTSLRLLAGAVTLWLVVWLSQAKANAARQGSWGSGVALYVYAGTFSAAYVTLTAGTGALLLFGAVQLTMMGCGLWRGDRLRLRQWAGLAVALAGLVLLLLPGVSAPPMEGAGLMLLSGCAWGFYSLRGQRQGDPMQVSAGNFLRAVPLAVGMSLLLLDRAHVSGPGVGYALLSGAVTSGLGYAIWYAAVPHLKAATAATVQLSVPLLASFAGILFLGETWTLRLSLASLAILGGIALVLGDRQRAKLESDAS
ncbi:MAG: DMT family transporter [Polaromonas sp.]|nr:DMT family transporter [Polaromonas sp.]